MNNIMNNFWDNTFLGNTYLSYAWFIGILLAGFLFKRFISSFLSWCLYGIFKRYAVNVSLKEFRDLLARPFSIFVTIIIIYLAFDRLAFPKEWNLVPTEKFGVRMVLFYIFEIAVAVSLTWIITRLVDFFGLILIRRAERTETKTDDQFIPYFKSGLKIIIVTLGIFFILGAIFKVNVVALVGGLGIGGLALALASKESVENLFGSVTIFFDKPFSVGDQVKVGNVEGFVENIGLRSTRIRTLERSLLTIPNKKMIDAESENLTLKTMSRARFYISLTYGTTAEQIKNITKDIHSFIDSHKDIRENPIVKFAEFNSSSLDILVVYFVLTNEIEDYISVKEEVNFKIMEIVQKHGSSFAFPSTSVYIEKNNHGQI